MTTDVQSLSLRLRDETRPHHERAEGHEFQKALLSGRLSRDAFVDSLEQFLALHLIHEGCLRSHLEQPQIRHVVRDYQFHESRLRQDLAFFGRDPESVLPLPGVEEFAGVIRQTASREPVALLGVHYVLEGSKNGSRHIAKVIHRVYGLEPGPGTLFQDPYGDEQWAHWQVFKANLDSAESSTAQCDSIVEAAKGTFNGIIAMMDELYSVPSAL